MADLQNYNMMRMSDTSQELNDRTFTDYFYRLMLLAKSVFKWNNLPNGIDEAWIEKYLFSNGQCMFFKHPKRGLMVAECTDGGLVNYYDEPTILRPVLKNEAIEEVFENGINAVLIKNNDIRIPTSPTIQLYALRLTEIARTIDTNIIAQKTPLFIKCTDKQKLSLKKIYKEWDGNGPVIFADKSLDLDSLEVLKTDAPIVFDKLQIQKHEVWNEVMSFLGINNANMQKRERLVDDEVQANNEQIGLSADVMLKARQRACELINKIFDTKISVEIRTHEIDEMGFINDKPSNSKGSESEGGEE